LKIEVKFANINYSQTAFNVRSFNEEETCRAPRWVNRLVCGQTNVRAVRGLDMCPDEKSAMVSSERKNTIIHMPLTLCTSTRYSSSARILRQMTRNLVADLRRGMHVLLDSFFSSFLFPDARGSLTTSTKRLT